MASSLSPSVLARSKLSGASQGQRLGVSQQMGLGRSLNRAANRSMPSVSCSSIADVVAERKRSRIDHDARALERTLAASKRSRNMLAETDFAVAKDKIGIDRQGALSRLRSHPVSAGAMRAVATAQAMRIEIARIGLCP